MGAVYSVFVLFYFHLNLLLFLGRFICPIKQRLHLLFLGGGYGVLRLSNGFVFCICN